MDERSGQAKASIPDFVIHDKGSFDAATRTDLIAKLYFFCTLDHLVDLAYAVSQDFFERPELFTRSTGLATLFAKLNARYGAHEEMLNKVQRAAVYVPVFGARLLVAEAGNFAHLRDELLSACVTYVETRIGDEPSLRNNVVQKHGLLKEYLTGLVGESIEWSGQTLHRMVEQSIYPVFRNPAVAAVYGVGDKVNDQWPYACDAGAPKLVEKISQALSPPARVQPVIKGGAPPPLLSRESITRLQRAALEGTRALATVNVVASGDPEENVRLLIQRCYTWANALRSLRESADGAGAVRARIEPLYSALRGVVGGGLQKVLGG